MRNRGALVDLIVAIERMAGVSMSEQSQSVKEAIRELVTANRILGNEGVVDA